MSVLIKKFERNRIPELDAIRGLAAIAVLFFHYSVFYKIKAYDDPFPEFDFIWGELGVSLFFLLSGFVILLSAERSLSCRSFVIGRFVRLWPTFFVCTTLTALWLTLLPLSWAQIDFKMYLVGLTLQPNVMRVNSIDGVYWSLHVEIQFYALIGLLLALNLKKYIVSIFGCFTLGCFLYQIILLGLGENNFLHYYFGIFRHAHLFFAGILCYRFYQTRSRMYLVLIILVSFGVLSSHWMREYSFGIVTDYVAFWLFVGLLLLASMKGILVLRNRVFLFLGIISYPLYLLHMMIGFSAMSYLNDRGLSSTVSVWGVIVFVLALASAVAWFIDIPLRLPLRKVLIRWFDRGASGASTSTT